MCVTADARYPHAGCEEIGDLLLLFAMMKLDIDWRDVQYDFLNNNLISQPEIGSKIFSSSP